MPYDDIDVSEIRVVVSGMVAQGMKVDVNNPDALEQHRSTILTDAAWAKVKEYIINEAKAGRL